jgi:iron-sulfur cluster assembly accessory protein
MSITVTELAINEVKRVMEEQEMVPEEQVLRLGVVGGGCSGFSYSMSFEKKTEGDSLNDSVYNFFGVETRVDRKSELYLEGATVDFHSGLDRRGFVFENPNSTKSCGCGSSFSV